MPNPPARAKNGALLPTAASLRERLLPLVNSMALDRYMAPETIVAIRRQHDTPTARAELLKIRREKTAEATPTEIITRLAELSIHYWAAELTESQQKLRFQHFCYDLKGVTPKGINDACTAWRRSENVHFPKPGQLLALCRDDIRQRRQIEEGLDKLEALLNGEAPLLLEARRGKLRPAAEIIAEYQAKKKAVDRNEES